MYLAGTLLAFASKRLIASRGEAELERLAQFGAAYGLWYGLCVGYLFFRYPDWMLVYLQDGAQLFKPLAYLFFLFVLAGCGASGALTCGWFLSKGRRRLAWAAFACGLFAVVATFRLTWLQYFRLGTTREFVAGLAQPTFEVPGFRTGATIVGILLVLPFVALGVWRYRLGTTAEAPPAKS